LFQVRRDFGELSKSGLEVLDDLLRDDVGIGKMALSSNDSSFNQKMSRLTLSRFVSSSLVKLLKGSASFRSWRELR
jgi:hypothetical protein